MVAAWLERESSWASKQALREFSEKLAINIYLNRISRGSEGVPYTELDILNKSWGIHLDLWQLGSRSLLNRGANDNFKFAHRSVMEYLFVHRAIFSKEQIQSTVFTDNMKLFLREIIMQWDTDVATLIESLENSANIIISHELETDRQMYAFLLTIRYFLHSQLSTSLQKYSRDNTNSNDKTEAQIKLINDFYSELSEVVLNCRTVYDNKGSYKIAQDSSFLESSLKKMESMTRWLKENEEFKELYDFFGILCHIVRVNRKKKQKIKVFITSPDFQEFVINVNPLLLRESKSTKG
jgi:hypothetical protein